MLDVLRARRLAAQGGKDGAERLGGVEIFEHLARDVVEILYPSHLGPDRGCLALLLDRAVEEAEALPALLIVLVDHERMQRHLDACAAQIELTRAHVRRHRIVDHDRDQPNELLPARMRLAATRSNLKLGNGEP